MGAGLSHEDAPGWGWGHSGRERIMTEASGGGGRAEMERSVVQRSLQDEEFRQRLLDDPKGTLEQELGDRLHESIEVRVVEESADTICLVLPSASPIGEGGEISDQELEAVAGGGSTDQRGGASGDTCVGTIYAAKGPPGCC
jgi:hypothetical protein